LTVLPTLQTNLQSLNPSSEVFKRVIREEERFKWLKEIFLQAWKGPVGKRMKKPTYWTCTVCGATLNEDDINTDLKDDPNFRAKVGGKIEGFLCGACGFKLLRANLTPRLTPDEIESFDASVKQEEKNIQKENAHR
jgi:hypothetical protein